MDVSGQRDVLVVEDDEFMAEFCATALRLDGWKVFAASNGLEALKALSDRHFNIVLTDYIPLPERRSIIELVKSTRPTTEVVVMTGMPSLETAMISFAEGARAYLAKPFGLQSLMAALKTCATPAPAPGQPEPEAAWLKEAMRDYFKSMRAHREPPRMPAILAVDERLSAVLYRVATELRREYGHGAGEVL